ncbi:MAG: sulfotransferase domain-containing protein [Salinibacter sp.]
MDDVDTVLNYIDSPGQEARSDYLATLDRWTAVFEPDQMHVAFFDNLRDAPEYLVEGVADFLGIDPRPMKESMHKRVNASPKKEMPPAVRDHLIEKYATDLRKLKDRLGGRATSWYNEL